NSMGNPVTAGECEEPKRPHPGSPGEELEHLPVVITREPVLFGHGVIPQPAPPGPGVVLAPAAGHWPVHDFAGAGASPGAGSGPFGRGGILPSSCPSRLPSTPPSAGRTSGLGQLASASDFTRAW